MKYEKSTTMSVRRVITSLLIYLAIPVLKAVLGRLIGSDTLAGMLVLNLGAMVLLVYDWELFGLHWNRAKANLPDMILYGVIGVVFLFFWILINESYLHGEMLMPNPETLHAYPIAVPPILFAYSFSLSVIINITFKCITDRFKVHAREAAMILLSGFLFGFIYTVTMVPLQFETLLQTYLFNVILISALSYLYNQTHSILPGMLVLSTALFAWQVLFIL